MTNKELKKLSRADLLELLLVQTKENETLKEKLLAVEKQLEERQLRLTPVGSLAEAMVAVNGVMDAAQAAADQYLENITAMKEETRKECDNMLQAARKEAAKILSEARRQQQK